MKRYNLKLTGKKRMFISLHAFRTAKVKRSQKKAGQYYLPVYLLLLPTKEVLFELKTFKTPRRAKKRPKLLFSGARSTLPLLLIIAGLCGTIFFSVQTSQKEKASNLKPAATFAVPVENVGQGSDNKGLPESLPKHIKIKRVGIDAPLMQLGQNKDKTMEVPPLFKNIAGWYKYSPTPGEVGPAVIAGHVDTYEGPSVFYRLKDLKAGDEIEVLRADKKIVKFKVTALKQFSQSNFPTKEVYGNIDYAGLRLITCGGTFNEKTQRYTANTVVFAKMIDEKS